MKYTKYKIDLVENIVNPRTLPNLQPEYLRVISTKDEQQNDKFDFNQLNYPLSISPVINLQIQQAIILGSDGNGKEFFEITFKNDVHPVPLAKEDQEQGFPKIKEGKADLCEFLPGDTIAILPENDSEEVEYLLKALYLNDEADFSCRLQIREDTTKKAPKIPIYIPTQTTYRNILKHFVNFRSIPKKSFLRSLSEYCEDLIEKDFLETLCSKEGSQIYNDLIIEKSLTVFDIFRICTSLKPPLSLLIEHLPRLLPRPYSISNFNSNKTQIRIIFSRLCENPGIATNFLRKKIYNIQMSISLNDCYIKAYFRQPTKFRLNEEAYSKNVIMISVGCAISPFLGFLEQKKYLIDQGATNVNDGNWYLYSGFKYKTRVIHREEILKYEIDGILDKYYECLSREENSKYKYVQDAIIETQNVFCEMLQNENTILYVCADGNKISKDIRECIQNTLFGCIDANSNSVIQQWIKDGKYIEDIWT